MSRVISIENAGKERIQLAKYVLMAIRELSQSNQDIELSRDLVAFIITALAQIAMTIDSSVAAWEKRGYWVKADRFRMEWGWAQTKSDLLYKGLINQDWDSIIPQVLQITQKLAAVKLPVRKPTIEPWRGAYANLMRESGERKRN
ncbi:MAG: hypothetical protein WCF08_04155 [Anaerolineaceae bacterium]